MALAMLVVLDVALTRSSLLWAALSVEHSLGFQHVGYVQTLQLLRRLDAAPPPDDGTARVVLLGDSRIWFAARAPALEQELAHVLPDRRVEIQNLGAFGSRIGDYEAISRYLDRLHPALVVVALGGEELVRDGHGHLATLAARVLDVGWHDGPLPPSETDGRLDRWLRTVWPLYRLRALVRLALVDRLFPERPPAPAFLDAMSSQKDLFDWVFGERAPQVLEAYQVWRRSGRLEDFVHYLQT